MKRPIIAAAAVAALAVSSPAPAMTSNNRLLLHADWLLQCQTGAQLHCGFGGRGGLQRGSGQWETVHPSEPATEQSPMMNLGCPLQPSYTGQAWFEIDYASSPNAIFPGAECTVLESSGDYYCPL